MPFSPGKVCLSFEETSFPFQDFSFLISYFEWYGYLPLFFLSLVVDTLLFAAKSSILTKYCLGIHTFLILTFGETLLSLFAFSTALKTVATIFINHHDLLFLKELQYSLINSVLNNILEAPTRISVMIPGVMILTIYFFPKFLFVKELVILEKCDEFLL